MLLTFQLFNGRRQSREGGGGGHRSFLMAFFVLLLLQCAEEGGGGHGCWLLARRLIRELRQYVVLDEYTLSLNIDWAAAAIGRTEMRLIKDEKGLRFPFYTVLHLHSQLFIEVS